MRRHQASSQAPALGDMPAGREIAFAALFAGRLCMNQAIGPIGAPLRVLY